MNTFITDKEARSILELLSLIELDFEFVDFTFFFNPLHFIKIHYIFLVLLILV